MHIEPRNGQPIDRVYLHTNEGNTTASNLANYLLNNGPDGGGYHAVVDNVQTVRCASDDEVTWGEGGDNGNALSLCFIGFASETPTDWTSPFNVAQIERGAQQVAAWCKAYNVPVLHVPAGGPGAAPTARGIAEHADDHDPLSQGHTDPGVGFPIAAFIARVGQLVAPPFIDWPAIEALQDWEQAVTANPLQVLQTRWEVTGLKELLTKIGEGPGNTTPFYGGTLANCVKVFKVAHNVGNDDGTHFGGTAAQALIKALEAVK